MRTLPLLLLVISILLNSLTVFAATDDQEQYIFERLWPTLPQPWHFTRAFDIAVAPQGHVYVINQSTNQLKKFTANGHLIRQWLYENDTPLEVEVSDNGYVYVLYARDRIITKDGGLKFIRVFNPDGHIVCEWGELKEGKYRQCADSQYPETIENNSIYNMDGMTIDSQGHVYLVRDYHDNEPSAIFQKFTLDGQLIYQWPIEIPFTDYRNIHFAINSIDEFYLVFQGDNSVSQYRLQEHRMPQLLQTWEGFNAPKQIAFDKDNNAYITDMRSHRILKLLPEGDFEPWVINEPYVDLPFEEMQLFPLGFKDQESRSQILALLNDYLPDLRAVQEIIDGLFDKSLDFSHGSNRFFMPRSIAIEKQTGHIYMTVQDAQESVYHYTLEGEFKRQWKSGNIGNNEQLYAPFGIARDSKGNLYVTDAFNHRVLKFSEQGRLIESFGQSGIEQGEFLLPTGIAVDTQDNIYVTDTGNLRLQKFKADGEFLQQFAGLDNPKALPLDTTERVRFILEKSELALPIHIALDSQDNVYVIDLLRNHVKKFNDTGEVSQSFAQSQLGLGLPGNDEGELDSPLGITIDSADQVYIVDFDNKRIQQFTTQGEYVNQWNEKNCKKDGEFFGQPSSITVDEQGHLYVLDAGNMEIVNTKFVKHGTTLYKLNVKDGQCELLEQWGKYGNFPGQFAHMSGLAVSPEGERVYLADTKFNHIQIFKKGIFQGGKAIIVAGDNEGLEEPINVNAKFVYRTLFYQGFTKNTLKYFSAVDSQQDDLDENGEFDDMDEGSDDPKSIKERLKTAITEWASDVDTLTLYLIDHGGKERFYLGDDDPLTADELAQWLDSWQQKQPNGIITLVYEACHSGSFIPKLQGDNRIIITSTDAETDAGLSADGALSFSGYFWSHIFYGRNIEEAYGLAKGQTESNLLQQPQARMKVSNLRKRYIGNGTQVAGNAPVIHSSPLIKINDDNTASFTVEVTDEDGDDIARVWAVVIHGHLLLEATGQPMTALPSCDLQPIEGQKGQFEAKQCRLFKREGHYEVSIYALDDTNNLSKPVTTEIMVGEGQHQKAVILVGGLEKTRQHYAAQAYKTLRHQGYSEDNIYYMTHQPTEKIAARTANLENIEGALTDWLEDNTQDLVIYLIGSGDDSSFTLSKKESLEFSQFKTWLDKLTIPVLVIYEGENSGDLLPALKNPPTERIVISSTEIESFYAMGEFSNIFWKEIFKGINVFDAFERTSVALTELSQQPQLDDNGDGEYHEDGDNYDGELAYRTKMGLGIGRASLPKQRKTQQSFQLHYQNERLKIRLPPLPEDKVQYVGIQLPDGSLYLLKEAIKNNELPLVPFDSVETMPIWEGTGEIAIDVKINATIPKGPYRFYRYIQPKEETLKQLEPENLSQTLFYLR
jgi:DNA-binding beta-propeller fold protein YncE